MNQNKKIIISLGIIFSIILLSISILKISVNILYPGNELSNSIKESFKDIFGKAIKFDTLYFKYNGNIVLQNFYLSNTDDFNDNINLIKCDEITIDTYLFDLIRKKVTFAGVYMIEPEITVIKNYGKSYYDTFIQEIIGGINHDKITQFISDGFRLELTDSNLIFRETHRNSKTEINFTDVDLKIKYKNGSILYRSFGNIEDKVRNSWFVSSQYKAIGKISLNNKKSEAEIELDNFDLTHLNNILNDRFTFRTLLSGNFSGKLSLTSENEIIKCKGSTELSSLNLFYYDKDIPHPLLKDKDIDTDFNFDLSEKFDKLTIYKLEIDDDTVELSSSLEYVENDFISIQLNTNKIDLNELSESIFLFNNCTYRGDISFNGICKYKLNENKPDDLNFNISLNRFSIIPFNGNSHDLTNIKDGNILLSANKDNIIIKTNFKTGNSDFNINYNCLLSSWNPFKSTNSIEIFSKNIELDLLKEISSNLIKEIYDMAYVDMFQNFDEQKKFLKEPEGIFINDNDISFKFYAEKVTIAGRSCFDYLSLDLSLLKGVLKTDKFALTGCNGIYSFDLYSSLRQDNPFFKFTAEAKDLNLNMISDQAGLNYSFGGKLSVDMNFETNAFRLGQVVENGKAGLNITIKDGYINNTPVQNKLNDFMVRNNLKDIFNKRIIFSDFSISFSQSGDSFYIKNFNLNSENIRFNSYGKYNNESGLAIPLSLNITDEITTDSVPLEITGNLEAPCLKVKSKNKTEPFCF